MRYLAPAIFLSIAATAVAAPQAGAPTTGSICGTVTNELGVPAKLVNLAAFPKSGAIADASSGGLLPQTRTDNSGHYCFPQLGFGEYLLTADDVDAGYPPLASSSLYSTVPSPSASVNADQPSADLNWQIPYKAAKLYLHVTDALTGKPIDSFTFRILAVSHPEYRWTHGMQSSRLPLLLPPGEDVVLRITAEGYHEWHDNRAGGGSLNYPAASEQTLNIPLQPKIP